MPDEMITYAYLPDLTIRNILGVVNDRELLFSAQIIKECQRILDDQKARFLARMNQEIEIIIDLCKQQTDAQRLGKIQITLSNLTRLASLFGYTHIQSICEKTDELIQSDKFNALSEKRKFELLARIALLMGVLCDPDKNVQEDYASNEFEKMIESGFED